MKVLGGSLLGGKTCLFPHQDKLIYYQQPRACANKILTEMFSSLTKMPIFAFLLGYVCLPGKKDSGIDCEGFELSSPTPNHADKGTCAMLTADCSVAPNSMGNN